MDSGVIYGLISGVTTGVILGFLGWAWQRWVRWNTTEDFRVMLSISSEPIPSEMKASELKFGVLHARNDDGMMVNRVHWFKKARGGEWYAFIPHPRNVGFQYKCFVDYPKSHSPENLIENLIKWLESEGYKDAAVGAGKPNRIWFILEGKPTAKDPAGNINNHYYPE